MKQDNFTGLSRKPQKDLAEYEDLTIVMLPYSIFIVQHYATLVQCFINLE
jgi:hypothetical protein